jgi:PKD repeat protein
LFTGATYQDFIGFDPVIGRPIDDLSLYEPQIFNEGWYPSRLQTILTLQTGDGVLQKLVVTPGQFISTSTTQAGKVNGTERLYSSLTYDVYYSTSQDYTASTIDAVNITAKGSDRNFTTSLEVVVNDPDDPGIPDDGRVRRVVAIWTAATGDTTWESIDLLYDSLSGTWKAEITNLPQPDIDIIIQAVDSAGNVGISANKGNFFSTILVSAGDDQTVNEGDTVQFTGSIDPAVTAPGIVWDFGDGSDARDVLNPTHVYADNGTYTVTLKVTDGRGGLGRDTLIVTVRNVAPIVNTPPSVTVTYGDPLPLNGSFTDPGSLDTHTYRWEVANSAGNTILTIWGNLNVTVNWLEWLPGYPNAGTYTATLVVTDDDGGRGQATTSVTIAKRDTALVLTSSVNPSIINQSVTLNARISVNPPAAGLLALLTGNVTFRDGTTTLATVPVATVGGVTSASFSTSSLPAGNRNITATYNGDVNFKTSTDSLVQTVRYKFGGFQSPVPGSQYNLGRTIPVKFTLTDFNDVSIGTAVANISVNGGGTIGTAVYNPTAGQYQYNLDTSGLPIGSLTITVALDDGTTRSISLQLK